MSFKLGEDVLVELVDIVREGITEGKDISDLLRNIKLEVRDEISDTLSLTDQYVKDRRGTTV